MESLRVGKTVRRLIPLGSVIVGLMVVGLVLAQLDVVDVSVPGVYRFLRGVGPSAGIVFLGLSLLRGLFFIPAGTFTIAAGIMFGPVLGPLLALAATAISSLPPFVISRKLGAGWVRDILADNRRDPRFAAAVKILRQKGFWGIALLRTMPFPPFDAISYTAGVLPLNGPAFFFGTALGSIPGVILFSYLGAELSDPFGPVFFILLGVLLVEAVIGYMLVRRFLASGAEDSE